MNSRAIVIFAAAAIVCATTRAANDSFHAPDSIVLKDGRTIHGLIVKNSVDSILMQEEFGERTYPKSEIVRVLERLGQEFGVDLALPRELLDEPAQ